MCGEVDTEEFYKKNSATAMTSDECAEIVKGAGFEFFVHSDASGSTTCKGCLNDSHRVEKIRVYNYVSIYQITPNYPMNLQDPANNKQCLETKCDPKVLYDDALGACMSFANVEKLQCHADVRGFIQRIDVTNLDETVVKSVDVADDATWTTQEIPLQAGERMTKISYNTQDANYIPVDGPCVDNTGSTNAFSISDLSAWTKVRHSPATGNWHPATDNLAGSEVYGDSTDDAVAWSTKFDDLKFTEMLFTFGDKSSWMIMTKTAAVGENYSD